MEKIIKDRLNALRSELQQEAVPKLTKTINHQKITSLNYKIGELEYILSKAGTQTNISRLEVIDHSLTENCRTYVKYGVNDLEISMQDEGRTMKIFIK